MASTEEYNSSRGCCHIIKISSLYFHQTSGASVCVLMEFFSSVPCRSVGIFLHIFFPKSFWILYRALTRILKTGV